MPARIQNLAANAAGSAEVPVGGNSNTSNSGSKLTNQRRNNQKRYEN